MHFISRLASYFCSSSSSNSSSLDQNMRNSGFVQLVVVETPTELLEVAQWTGSAASLFIVELKNVEEELAKCLNKLFK